MPIEILPYGRTREQAEALERRKQQGRNGLKGCLFQLVALALVIVYCAGWIAGNSR